MFSAIYLDSSSSLCPTKVKTEVLALTLFESSIPGRGIDIAIAPMCGLSPPEINSC